MAAPPRPGYGPKDKAPRPVPGGIAGFENVVGVQEYRKPAKVQIPFRFRIFLQIVFSCCPPCWRAGSPGEGDCVIEP